MYELLYRDDEGLRNLAAQADDFQVTGLTVEEETAQEKTKGAKPSVSSGKLLAAAGLPDVSISGDYTSKTIGKRIEKTEYSETSEATYRSVLKHLNGRRRLYTNSYEAWCAARASTRGVFCEFQGRFRPAGWTANGEAWREFANAQGSLILHSIDDTALLVGMSLKKIFGCGEGVISQTCHLALHFRGGQTSLRIFGRMDSGKYVKPYFATYLF